MDVDLGLFERIQKKRQQNRDANDIPTSHEHNCGDIVRNRIVNLDVSSSPEPCHLIPKEDQLFAHDTLSPKFSKIVKKISSNGRIRNAEKIPNSRQKKGLKKNYNPKLTPGLDSMTVGRSNTPILDNKDHENCMETAANILKTIGGKYVYNADRCCETVGETVTQECRHEDKKQGDALERLKIVREKRKSRGEMSPEKPDVSNKFPRYNSGFLGWPSESESSSEGEDFIPLRSVLPKSKASASSMNVTSNSFKSKHNSTNYSNFKSSVFEVNTNCESGVRKVKPKMLKRVLSLNNSCDKSQYPFSDSIQNLPCDKNGKIIGSGSLKNHQISTHKEIDAEILPTTNSTASGAITKIKTSGKGRVKAKISGSPSTALIHPASNCDDIFSSPFLYTENKCVPSLNKNKSSSPALTERINTIPQMHSQRLHDNLKQQQTFPKLSTSTESGNLSSGDVSASHTPRIDSPDLILLGISPPNLTATQRRGKQQRTGTRAADLRNHRATRQTGRRINNIPAEAHVDDAVQVIQQITTDEDYARKLQEEMDKEFAVSLVQGQGYHDTTPVPAPISQPFPTDPTNRRNLDFLHVNNLNFGPHHWHSPPRRRAAHNARAAAVVRNRRLATTADMHVDIDMIDGASDGFNANYGVNLLNPRYVGASNALEMMESHLMALLEDNTPPRRGRRRGNRRNPRSYGTGFYSPVGDGNDYETLLQLAEELGDVQQKGICDGKINRLPVKQYKTSDKSSTDPEDCSICMCEYEEDENLRILPCFHRFHARCVDKWLQNNASCPVCRVQVKLE
ncbi:uncharacterized protein LOC126825382 isoform X2 [Patella vulgata]|nr:uncharacterized protein LOC126825382 isoform X2 [Patella vulgata]XP_050410952.1 uncharacterized protein LOC126825382 isoform X2 [Patella vulgata]